MKRSREHQCWLNMKDRCLNPDNKRYANYGGRGITICQRWLDSFEAFLVDMGPSHGLTIERKDVNGNYEPTNCIWLPSRLQALNKTNNRIITGFGRSHHLTEWAAFLKITPALLHYHLNTGKTIEQIYEELNPAESICICGQSFTPKRKWQTYCTDKCKEEQRAKRRYGKVAA